MSGEKVTSPCNKFQANIFNKSKCQNCFKSRELHLLNDQDMEQAKPVYGGWLCLAPEGTDFDNPMQRSRKWQRRFFILYEHGSLSFALDELPSTLPQGTVNMNLCTDIADAEPRTGQRNALCIVTPEQEIFIRGDSKEIINGWSEQLVVYLKTNKQNQKKKRKVETVSAQEPSPPKMAATVPSSESTTASSRWQDSQRGGGVNTTPMWTVADPDPPSPELTAADDVPVYLSPTLNRRGLVNSSDSEENGNPRPQESDPDPENIQTSADDKNQSQNRSLHCQPGDRMLSLKTTGGDEEGGAVASRTGRSEARTSKREKLQSCGDMAQLNAPPPQRRAKSLDRRTTDTVMTPDLLNFKKGWMVKLDENNQWRKYWFVLSTDSLRYYKDSVAEEASDLEGEIDLTKCYNVSEYQVQRNYGFQIHTPKGVYTLSAMTAGIRKNWIQALMKNVHPSNAPDVASLRGHHVLCSPPEALPKPDVTQDSTDASSDPHPRPRSVTERRREGRYRTFDWAEFRPQTKPKQDADPPTGTPASSLMELGDLARRKRRDERRKRYESMLGFPLDWEAAGDKMAEGGVRALSPKSQQKVEEEIEEYWRQVERTVFRPDRTVPLGPETKDDVDAETETLLETYKKAVEDLKAQLAESELSRLDLEAQLNTNRKNQQNVCPSLDANFNPLESNEKPLSSPSQSLKDMYEETRELLQQQNAIRHSLQEQLTSPQHHIPTIRLHDSDGNLTQLDDFLSETVVTPLLSPASESDSLHFDGLTLDVDQNSPSPEALLDISECSPTLLISEQDGTGDGVSLSCVDQAVLRRLSQEVELLTNQNKALNQHNQEMLNQLTEADREIERLKAELSGRYSEPLHLPESEQMGRTRVEELEKELNVRNQELMEAQTLITTLEENVKETEALLQLGNEAKEAKEKNVVAEKTEGYLLRCFEATEAKLSELERKLEEAEVTCRELQVENEQLKEAEKVYSEKATEDVRRLKQELEENQLQNGKSLSCLSGEERIQKVKEGVVLRFKALGKILEVVEKLDLDAMRRSTESDLTELKVVGQLRREESFWRSLLGELKATWTNDEEPLEELLREVTEFMIVEKQMLILGHVPISGGSESETSGDEEVMLSNASETAAETKSKDETTTSDFNYQLLDVDKSLIEHFSAITQIKLSLLDNIISAQSHLQLTTERVCEFLEHPWSGFIHSAATEALYCCHISSLQAVHQREMNQQRLNMPLTCSECVNLMEKNMEMRERLSNLEEQISHRMDTWTQTDETCVEDTDPEPQIEDEAEEDVEYKVDVDDSMEVSSVEDQPEIQEMSDESKDTNDASLDPGPNLETELVLELRQRVEELEEQLRVTTEQMTEEMDVKMSSVQEKHEEEMEKLKATCERGFNSMEESHVKILEELQRRHRQEIERLLVERDRLLEEESAATATAIEAIKNAHRLELEREVQRRCQSEYSTADSHLEDLHRQHREELASYQRELQVLSQQYSLKCLENGHLVQALDAERKALCQCQQENQDLRTRNQELSGHLAAEITRLCSLAKQDELPLSQGMDVYEMEITLRVKESEVQCLKQEITSLKDELQSAQRDKRNATKKYKDMFTELNIVRAKTERDLDELRENLRLAHQALGQTSP
ncbi:myosin phosphatase Rho-interacting protein-like [Sphaeramia orbicularis]|uniref:myosin phosphatase Rho-interacting protein-like n=1 Tax=Sphaeramia orbicularis TaxID=375764 RepID=UPI00117F7D50|nr:myosin phosphatase Rho-interacting protein-like [Sphaeramia orbicularis]